jgi:hypothetical protein
MIAFNRTLVKRLLLLLVIPVFLFACKYDKPDDSTPPLVVINTPFLNQHFVTGDTIRITGLCTDNKELDEVPVHITDEATRQEFFHNHYGLIHSSTFNVNTFHVVTTTARTRYTVAIEAKDIDHNKAEKEVIITIN